MFKFLKKIFFDPSLQRRKAFLKTLEIFKDLGSGELARLAQSLHSRTYHGGEVIFEEGDIGRALFVLESGTVDLVKRGPDGEARKIFTLKPGDFFGEMALLEQLPRTATATAAERSHLYLLYRTRLEEILNLHPRIGASIMTHLAQILSARLRRNSAVAVSETAAGNG